MFALGQVLPSFQGLILYLCFPLGSLQGVPFSSVQSFSHVHFFVIHLNDFPFFRTTKLERLHRASSRVITGVFCSRQALSFFGGVLTLTAIHSDSLSPSYHRSGPFVFQPPFPFLVWSNLRVKSRLSRCF